MHASPELTPSIVQKTAKEDKALAERLKEVSSEGLLEKIAADEDVVKLLRRVVDEKANYFKRLTPAQRRIEMRAGLDQQQGIKQLLNEIPMQFIDYGFIKAQTMSYYKTVISVYQLKSELEDIRKELKMPAKGKGDLQYKKQLALAERSLMQQITEKQVPFDLSSDRVADLVECNEKLKIFLESETGLQFK